MQLLNNYQVLFFELHKAFGYFFNALFYFSDLYIPFAISFRCNLNFFCIPLLFLASCHQILLFQKNLSHFRDYQMFS